MPKNQPGWGLWVMPAASTILNKVDMLGWKEDEKYLVVTDRNTNLCVDNNGKVGGSWQRSPNADCGGYRMVCISTGGHIQSKATFAHEIGHGIHGMNDGPSGSYTGDKVAKPQNSKCIFGTGGAHSYHSREWTGGAAQEGFCDFVATTVYNDYGSTGEYVVNKPTYDISGNSIPTWTTMQLAAGSDGNYTRYTQHACPPPANFKSLGSRHDWMNFFWGLWNADDTDARYSVSQINEVWHETTWTDSSQYRSKINTWCLPITTNQEPGWTCKFYPWDYNETLTQGVYLGFLTKYAVRHYTGKRWEDVLNTAEDKYEESNRVKFELFRDTGEKAGVTY